MNEQHMTTQHARAIIGVGIVVIILIALFGFFTLMVLPVHAPGTSKPVATTLSTYTSSTYGYTFEYPHTYALEEYSPEYVSIGTTSENYSSVAEVDVLLQDASDSSANFADFAHEQAKLSCAADGPSSSIDCPAVSRTASFTTASGLMGEEFYLTQDTHSHSAGSVVETERGPYIAFSLTPTEGSPYRLLLVRPPSATDPDTIDEAVVTAIARSVRIPSAP